MNFPPLTPLRAVGMFLTGGLSIFAEAVIRDLAGIAPESIENPHYEAEMYLWQMKGYKGPEPQKYLSKEES